MKARRNQHEPFPSQDSAKLLCRRLAVTSESIERLKLDANNPRLHSRTQIKQIARSIESFGFNVPVLVDGELNVVAGHGRLLACQASRLEQRCRPSGSIISTRRRGAPS